MKKLFCIFIILFLPFLIFSEETSDKKDLGGTSSYYVEKQFDLALNGYLKLLEQGHDNFEINYNIGCCYFKLNEFGKARFYFERALFYKPFDRDLFHNLNVIYHRVLKNPLIGEQVIMTKRIMFFIPKNIIVLVLLFLLLCSIIFFVLLYLIVEKRRLFLIFFTICVVFLLLFTVIFFIQCNNYYQKVFVVASNTANVYPGPDEYETALLTLTEGISGYIIEEIDNYARIKLKDNSTGWIKKDKIIYAPVSSSN